MKRSALAPLVALLAGVHCQSAAPSAPSAFSRPDAAVAAPTTVEAGFLEVPARDVTVSGAPVSIAATGRLFYNLRPADEDAENKPIFFLFNGFAAEIVRAFGTGPTTVDDSGAVVTNPTSYTGFANLVYLEPRQSGYSYDVIAGRAPGSADCAPGIFNEYVDAADVLLAALAFLDAHPELHGPVYWMGESYAGVRITWILAYLRGRWDLVPYADPTLATRLAQTQRGASLMAGQILLEAWLAGGAHTTAIDNECSDPAIVAAVSASVGAPCPTDACTCTSVNNRSPYNYTYTNEYEIARETQASEAHINPAYAAALIGIPLTSIPLLTAADRAAGFRCAPPDDTVPPEDALVATLGALPAGQFYYAPFSPLYPGKSTVPTTPDWRTLNLEAIAFADNLHDVPAFLTAGARDLVVPTSALAPALESALGASRVDTTSADRIGVTYPDGERFVDLFPYESAGHMVEMVTPAALAADVQSWVAQH
jgi:Serine carboxypeptidase